MNRRQFLQALAALGASVSIPVVLQSASAAQVDEAWDRMLADPWWFEVNDYGTIVEPGVPEPRIRADVFDVWDRQPRDPEHLIDEVEGIAPLVSAFQVLAADERDDLEYQLSMLEDVDEDDGPDLLRVERGRLTRLIVEIADEDDGWKALVRRDGKPGIDRYWDFIDAWLEEPIDWGESDWFPSSWHGQGKALVFFHHLPADLCDSLGVVIVEGEHPGGRSYFAAELRNDIADANAEAARLGLPFRFRAEGGSVMSDELYAPDEHRLLEAWFAERSLTDEEEEFLVAKGIDHGCEPYTRLAAWVGAFAVRDIQERLPNCGICREDGVILTRPIQKNRRSKKVAGAVRFLFRINWADSAPGFSWPVDYHLTWLPGFDRFVLTASADGTDMFGYCDFALGSVGPADDWRQIVREILVDDWRAQFNGWNQAPWAYLLGAGLVREEEAMAWRREAWEGHEEFPPDDHHEGGQDEVHPDAGDATGGSSRCEAALPTGLAGVADSTCRLEGAAASVRSAPTPFVRDLMSAGRFSREEAEFWADIT